MPAAQGADPTEHASAIEALLFDYVDTFDVPSAAVAVITADGEALSSAVGARTLVDNAPATPDTLYAVGSVTKSFTAAAVMQQVEAGRLDLDASPGAYTDAAFDGVEDVTLHDLLRHGSGLPSLAVSEGLIAQQTDYADPPIPIGDREDFYQYLNGAGGERLETERFRYSNSGYMLLADAVTSVTGRPFVEVIEHDLLEPLGMERSTMAASVFDSDDDTMTPYRRSDDGDGWEATPVPVRALSRGPGGLFTSVRELGAYLRMYLNGGLADDGTRVLDRASIERMTGAHMTTPDGPYGYGWRTIDLDGHEVIGHGGSVGVSTAYAGWSPELDLGVAVACNASPGHGLRALGTAVVHTAVGQDPFEAQPVLRRHRRQETIAGRYETYRGARTATVEVDGPMLRLTLEEPLPLSPVPLVFDEATERGYRYWTPTADGRHPVDVHVEDDRVEVHYDRWRLHRIGPV